MDKLATELTRLYALPDHPVSSGGDGYRAATLDGHSRCLCLRFPKPADWSLVGSLVQQAQEDWELPIPAVSVSPTAGFEVWWSLADVINASEVRCFGDWLLAATLPAEARDKGVVMAGGETLALPPACDPASHKWSAFIDPTLVGMFAEEAGLDFPPNAERQAEMLAGLKSVPTELLTALRPQWCGESAQVEAASVARATPRGRSYTDPREFLLDVMNDEAAGLAERIRAAEVLLGVSKK